MNSSTLALLVAYQLKHFLCDFPLQGTYMLGKFKGGTAWIKPLAAHASVHAAATFLIAIVALWSTSYGLPIALGLAAADFSVHFVVDRLKASPALGGRWKPDNKFFWWALGADQMAHHLTHYAIIATIIGVK